MTDNPTVGRVVHFYSHDPAKQFSGAGDGPYAAVVTQRFEDGGINLKVFPPFGAPYDEGSVPSKQAAESSGNGARWWEWPPRV